MVSARQFRKRLDAAKAGDHRACRWIWETYAGPVKGFLDARGTPDLAEVVNDTFLAAFQSLDRFEGDQDALRAWLHGIARHKRVDSLRRGQRRTPTIDTSEHAASIPSPDDVEADALAALADHELRRLLVALTPDQRDVIVLRFVADLSLQQVAVVLDKPVGAIKALQHRALEQLRKIFKANPYPEALPDTKKE